ncbi:hypothetical protein ACFP3U_30140 [Kitasatospora misakiensis]|uniref:Uncharacterized protein n=1 Tax=Kitasatospora misakiensis TaxID=67330 RepID=A0ABW0XDM7_9ACTN
MVQRVGFGVAAAGGGPGRGAFGAPLAVVRDGGSPPTRPRQLHRGGRREHGLCCDTAHSFTVTLLALLPAAYLTVFELSDGYPGGDPAMYLLFVLPLLLLPFAIGARAWADHWWPALRWFRRAALYYTGFFLVPLIVLLELTSMAFTAALGGTWTTDSQLLTSLELVVVGALLFGGPVIVALLMVAPWAVRGLDARPALAVLANLVPAFMVMIGGIPAVVVVIVHLVFTCRVMPAATLRRSHPDGSAAGQRPAGPAPTHGGTGDRP